MRATVDVSAQFGGEDAAQTLMPCFRALKAAAAGFELSEFPFANLTFILRVDGKISKYGIHGLSHIEVSKKGGHVAIDLGITQEEKSQVSDFISAEIQKAAIHLSKCSHPSLIGLQVDVLTSELVNYSSRFQSYLIV